MFIDLTPEQYALRDQIREYFRDLVSEALGHRRLQIQEATEFYLVDLLARHVEAEALFVARPDGTVELEPLAITLLRALQARRQGCTTGAFVAHQYK